MAVFDWVESPGTGLDEEPRVSRTRYGDGYEERALDGLNPIRQRWRLNFRGVDSTQGDAMVAFFRARCTPVGGFEAFDWMPLWSTTVIRVVCPSWSRTLGSALDECDITATFEQVFES